jgi:hypothetical protein
MRCWPSPTTRVLGLFHKIQRGQRKNELSKETLVEEERDYVIIQVDIRYSFY